MNKLLLIPSFAALLLGALPAEAKHFSQSSGQPIAIDQAQPYTYTSVRDNGNHTQVKARELKPQQFQHLTAQLDHRMDKMTEQALAGKGSGSQCGVPGGANYAGTNQTGSNDTSRIAQFGSGNSAGVNQTGADDRLYAFQSGTGFAAQMAQSGDHEITFVQQRCR